MTPSYSEGFKARMVERLTRPGAPSATALSQEVGVPQPTLSKWVRQAGRVGLMSQTKRKAEGLEAKRPQDWTPQEKLEVVLESASRSDDDLGAFLRARGVHRATLERWRAQMLRGLEPVRSASSASSTQARKIRTLQKELRRKEKALAEAAALLVLQKKVRALWEDEDDATTPRSGR